MSGERPADVTVLGLVPQSLDMCLELSELISSSLDSLVDAAVNELSRLGYPLRARPGQIQS